jgi:hypothetical protein
MTIANKNPYSMNLLVANKTKLYNQGSFWALNTAKYRALLSNDPIVIKNFYRSEAGRFWSDNSAHSEIKRSFYYSEENTENAEQYFGIIPMLCEGIAKIVCGSGYEFSDTIPNEIKERLRTIIDDNKFDTNILKASLIEVLALGSAAWHIHFDPEISRYPIIELIPPERLEIERRYGRVSKYTIKQQVMSNNEPQPYELHTIYTKNRKEVKSGNVAQYIDDGIKQVHKIWNGSQYLEKDILLKTKIFKEYDISEKTTLPLANFPVIYLHNSLGNAAGAVAHNNARPYGVVFGLESASSALDEILSNCVDVVRKAFPFLLIDEKMIPSDIQGNKDANSFSTRRHSFVTPKNGHMPRN